MTSLAIVGNGTPLPHGEHLNQYDYIIAADGGASYCVMHNVVPHWIIGDGDSLDPEIDEVLKDIPHHIDSNQDTTDLQKSLLYANTIASSEQDFVIDLWCVTSEHRADHTQAAFHALRYNPLVRSIHTADMIIWHAQDQWQHAATIGSALSVIPCSATALVSITGCEWSGERIQLNEEYSGVSNITVQPHVEITVHEGDVYICMDQQAL